MVDQISFAEESFQMNLIRVEDENESDNDQFAEVTVLDIYSDEQNQTVTQDSHIIGSNVKKLKRNHAAF